MRSKHRIIWLSIAVLVLSLAAAGWIKRDALAWRFDNAATYLRGVFDPIGDVPQAVDETGELPAVATQTESPSIITLKEAPAASTPVGDVLPSSMTLTAPAFDENKDYQAWNNCGPATLALALRYWGWQGDQYKVAAVVKPNDQDKNVNIEELAGYAQQNAGLSTVVRVAGETEDLKRFIAAGYPVVVEMSFQLTESFWPGDDRWSSHFTLLTGYDDELGTFTAQDAYSGPDTAISFEKLNADWQSFNYIYLVVFPGESQGRINALLGEDLSETANWQKAALRADAETRSDPQNAFAWFNLGSSLVATGNYDGAWQAFQTARQLGLPQRMLRYQFGPFTAAWQTGHAQDLLDLSAYALQVTSNSEEALYWQGQAFLAMGQESRARESFLHALSYHPDYQAALDALASIK